ncbi:MAG: GNAT family N-acetyltransferase [Saccharofermentanales bacterium]|jgi:ribosomal protein S18 acetylase RimI-like enzyme|nr:GNAT family N-acetyltransferase [Clostridiaceae bacterium]
MISIEPFTEDKIDDVMTFERRIRKQETDTYLWDAGEDYRKALHNSFHDPRFVNAVSLLAYRKGKVIGRIDASIISSKSDAACSSAYLDWICVLKSERHNNVAQMMLEELRKILKHKKVEVLIALMASNEEAQKFYRSIRNASIQDGAIWINTN